MTGAYILPAVKSADSLTVSASSVRANEALRSSESEMRRRGEPSGGSRSRDTVKVYVPDCAGVKAGRTASTSEAESALYDPDGETVGAEAVDMEEGQIILIPLSCENPQSFIASLGQSLKFRDVNLLLWQYSIHKLLHPLTFNVVSLLFSQYSSRIVVHPLTSSLVS